ncbi:FAD-binding oxidoreductase [Comamonas sp. CMM03]|uniref:NAD(P)/FAD-dependent oxidoreductase n=1 Tax=Comamonas TaxID=283 RepID=UPI001C45FC05|nr:MULTISPECIES: FAD-binding oxidoreductase [Comamonas]MBV7419063.1 FAD-binding oxidoreductase [Comamonas sp. CMM03]MDH1291647.1 FAD-binding oxidoreductase [Comamonas terrigena]
MQTVGWDVVVVGAGMAGAAAGWQLAQAGQRVLVLERESQPGYHTTGRSAALFEEHYGPAQVQALTRASRAFYDTPPAGFADAPILSPRGVLYIATAAQRALLDAAYAEALRHAPAARRLDAAALRALVPVLQDGIVDGFLDEGARDIDVHGLHQGFLRGLRQAGGALWCSAEVTALARAAGLWTVTLADGRSVQAPVVVNAAGAWADVLGGLAGAAPIGLTPRRRSAFTFGVPEGVDATHWPAVISADESFYIKPDAGQLLGSPANADATTPHDVQPEELDVATGIWRIEEATTLQIRRPSHTWAGLRSFVADGELVVGWDASPTPLPGFFWLAAQGGYGIQSAAGYSLLARNLILGEAVDATLRAQGVDAAVLSPARVQRV